MMTKMSTGPPDITSHPSSQLTTINMSVTLNCVGVGKGTIKYLWEISNNNGGPWTKISNSNGRSLVVRNLSQSRHYRCVVSNDAGRTTSNVATITVLSEFYNHSLVIYCAVTLNRNHYSSTRRTTSNTWFNSQFLLYIIIIIQCDILMDSQWKIY